MPDTNYEQFQLERYGNVLPGSDIQPDEVETFHSEFRAFQIDHYTERLDQETSAEGKAFLRAELHNLKKVSHD